MTADPAYPIPVPQTAPTPPTPVSLLARDTSPAYLAQAGAVLAEAFKAEPVAQLLNGGIPGLGVARMMRTVTTGTLDWETYVVDDPDDGILGVMVVKPPGYDGKSSPNSEGPHTAPAKELSALAPQLKAITPALMDALSALEAEAFGPREVTDLFYVSHLGISPAAQGRGVGTALCEYIVRRGREVGVAVSLVTMSERHVAYYERFGFRNRASAEVEVGGERFRFWALSTDV